MDTALPQKFPFILDRNLAKANCTENRVCTSCDTVVLGYHKKIAYFDMQYSNEYNLVQNHSSTKKNSILFALFLHKLENKMK